MPSILQEQDSQPYDHAMISEARLHDLACAEKPCRRHLNLPQKPSTPSGAFVMLAQGGVLAIRVILVEKCILPSIRYYICKCRREHIKEEPF